MCFKANKTTLETLRGWVKGIALFELFLITSKLGCEIGGLTYYASQCKSEAETEIKETFCQKAEDLLLQQFVPASTAGRVGAIFGILVLDLADLLNVITKYFAVKHDNSSGSKLSFRLGIFFWFIGITFWLYLMHASPILIGATIFVYILRYIVLLFLRTYLASLARHKTHERGKPGEPDEEVTKL